jgi:probable HAF family extracellular repeat protein
LLSDELTIHNQVRFGFTDMSDLFRIDGSSMGKAINNKGQIVGSSSSTFSSPSQAFLYSSGQMMNLNTLIDPNLG